MHDAVVEYCRRYAHLEHGTGLDIGGRNVSAGIGDATRLLWPNIEWTVMDLVAAPEVHIVADASTLTKWRPETFYDVVTCTEVFEHTPDWPRIIHTARNALKYRGRAIFTCAGPNRGEHSAITEGPLQPGEYYHNLSEDELYQGLYQAGFTFIEVETRGFDVRGTGIR